MPPYRQHANALRDAALGLLALARECIALKGVPRTGWLDRGMSRGTAESVADHSYSTALLAWACALERQAQGAALDPTRVLQLALIHDLAEASTGDVPPYDAAALPNEANPAARRAFLDRRHVRDDAARTTKRAAEATAMQRLLAELPGSVRGELIDLWRELNEGSSNEARFVKQADRLETFLQSRSYLRDHPELPVDSFRREVLETIDDPLLTVMRDEALKMSSDGNTTSPSPCAQGEAGYPRSGWR